MRLVAGDLVPDIRNLGRVAMMVVVLATIGYLANHSGGGADGQFRRRPIQSGLAEGTPVSHQSPVTPKVMPDEVEHQRVTSVSQIGAEDTALGEGRWSRTPSGVR
jgi:hypothetical protein